jgi:hypothetical protein
MPEEIDGFPLVGQTRPGRPGPDDPRRQIIAAALGFDEVAGIVSQPPRLLSYGATLKAILLISVPEGVLTCTGPPAAPGGTVAMICVG